MPEPPGFVVKNGNEQVRRIRKSRPSSWTKIFQIGARSELTIGPIATDEQLLIN